MNKLTCSAIALTMTCATGFASDSEWSALDQEVGALASTLSMDGGASLSGLLQSAYMSDGDTDTGGWATSEARLAVDGSHGDYGYHVDFDFAGDGLRGAYATWGMTDSVSAQMGQFRASVCNDADTDEGSMKHFTHSAVGSAFTNFSSGLGLSGAMSDISWALSIMNGEDGTGDELATAIRVSMDLMDGGEGGMDVSASVAIVDDSGVTDDAGATVIEVNAGNGTWGIGIETADAGAGGSGSLGNSLEMDSGCMAISLSYNVTENWEVAVRLTDMDDMAGNESTEITANNYLDGHGLKWQIGMADTDNDAGTDTSVMMIGLTVAF